MEEIKISKGAKSVILDNGVELTYCEMGEENEEVLISGAFYFHTFMPVLEGLAKKYHVYGIVMRFDGITTELNSDGTTNWSNQWGNDVYEFAKKMGVEKFHYIGKCHGVNPGWYLIKNHPEVLDTFCSFYLAPHLCEQNSNTWSDTITEQGPMALMSRTMRKQEMVPVKLAEVKTLGPAALTNPGIEKYASAPEKIWDSLTECEEDMKKTTIPVCLMFGTDDILFHDHYDSNIKAFQTINRCKSIFLQGERHLMELDCPERIVSEAIYFIEESRKKY